MLHPIVLRQFGFVTAMTAALGVMPMDAHAWILTGAWNQQSREGFHDGGKRGALWANSATVNTVSVTVPAAQVGSGSARP